MVSGDAEGIVYYLIPGQAAACPGRPHVTQVLLGRGQDKGTVRDGGVVSDGRGTKDHRSRALP